LDKSAIGGQILKKQRELVIKKETVMDLWPSKKQWKSWTLLSKYTALAFLFTLVLGIVAIIVSIVSHCLSIEQSKHTQFQLDGLFMEKHGEELKKKYPGGHMLLRIDSSKNISKNEFIPSGSNFMEEYELDWNKFRINKITDSNVTLELPWIRYKPQNTRIDDWTQTIPRLPIGKSYPFKGVNWQTNKYKLYMELVEDKETVFAFAIGFKPKYYPPPTLSP